MISLRICGLRPAHASTFPLPLLSHHRLGNSSPLQLKLHVSHKTSHGKQHLHVTAASCAQDVYILQTPLVGMEGFDKVLPPPLADVAALHSAVILVVSTDDGIEQHVWLFDFLPQNPQDPITVATLLAQSAVPGDARCRRLKALPRERRRCKKIGATPLDDAVARAIAFQREWNGTELQLFKRDCRNHVNALVKHLQVIPTIDTKRR